MRSTAPWAPEGAIAFLGEAQGAAIAAGAPSVSWGSPGAPAGELLDAFGEPTA